MKRTAIIPYDSLPSRARDKYDDEGRLQVAWVHTSAGVAKLKTVDEHTATNAETMKGAVEDHLDSFDRAL